MLRCAYRLCTYYTCSAWLSAFCSLFYFSISEAANSSTNLQVAHHFFHLQDALLKRYFVILSYNRLLFEPSSFDTWKNSVKIKYTEEITFYKLSRIYIIMYRHAHNVDFEWLNRNDFFSMKYITRTVKKIFISIN